MKTGARVAVLVMWASLAGAACSSSSTTAADTSPVSECAKTTTVERFKELMIVDESVIADDRTRSDVGATGGRWSFRYAVESMKPAGMSSTQFVRGWLDDWVNTKVVNGFPTDREDRAQMMYERVVCPWMRSTPENQCDETCSPASCTAHELDLAKAPFRLIGIANRMDLHLRPDSATPAGEARLLFGYTDGPGADPASPPLAMTVIFEYGLPVQELSPKQWAEAWHNLSKHAAFDEGYKADLEKLTERFVARNASPGKPSGSALNQVRTNESVLNWIWQLRQFGLNSSGELRLMSVSNTPGESINGSTILSDYVTKNLDAIKHDRHVLPTSLLGGSADQFLYRWNVPGTDEATRIAFARGTCNGCHSGENTPIDKAFHVSPFRKGTDKLSPFLFDPQDPAKDELGNRTTVFTSLLCD